MGDVRLIGGRGGNCTNKSVETPINVNTGGRAAVMLKQTLEAGVKVMVVSLRAGV